LRRKAHSKKQADPSGIAISGDPLGSRILALLLRDAAYQAEFMPLASLSEPGALEDVQLLVLAPTREALSTEERKALLAFLKEMPRDKELIVVELVSLSEERLLEEEKEAEAQKLLTHKILWPCRIDELEQQIEAFLSHGRVT
jgi:hypothetical protein